VKTALYWAEMVLAPLLSTLLLFSQPSLFSPIYFALGVIAWTFIEYSVHRFYLHDMKAKEHLAHHQNPKDKIYSIQWRFWLGVIPTVLVHPAFTSGILLAFAYYLLVHHCDHHARQYLSPRLLAHHDGHHRKARTNFGVSVTFWDILFKTRSS
jgi:sterol desaturase/sphingolipid hydroxylase (fatty acid hydroxylase superfamily)